MQLSNLRERTVVSGEGRPILFAHGAGGPKTWDLIAERLAKHFQVIVPAFPGFLPEDGLINYSDQLYVDFLESLRSNLGIKEWCLIGTSLGGRTILNYTLQHEEKVSQMVVIDSVGLNNISLIFKIPFLKKICPSVFSLIFSTPDRVARLDSKDAVDQDSPAIAWAHSWLCDMIADTVVRTNYFRIIAGVGAKKKEWNEQLPNLNTPTLILWASDDKICPVNGAYKLASLIKNSKVSILEGYRHLAILEKPDFFVDEIIKFLEEKQVF
jgi:pimeloyl-ACP methyl ester carboxylesterase